MPSGIGLELEYILHNFFWEGQNGGKISHLVCWKTIINSQQDGGLGVAGLSIQKSEFSFACRMRLPLFYGTSLSLEINDF